MGANGTNQQLIIDQGPVDHLIRSRPVWSPDGTQLAFTEQANARGALVIISADGTNRRVLATGQFTPEANQEPVAPAWSPDSQQLAFVSWDGPRAALQLFNFADQGLQTLDSGFLYEGGPYWVPVEGLMGAPAIGYAVLRQGASHWQIITLPTAQIEPRPTGLAMVSASLAWQFRSGTEGLRLLSTDGIQQQAWKLPATFDEVSWGNAANQFVMVNAAGNLEVVDIANNNQQVITELGGIQSVVWAEPLWVLLP